MDGKGYINRDEVIDLSQKLQCGEQVPELLRETLGDEFTDGKVGTLAYGPQPENALNLKVSTVKLGRGGHLRRGSKHH